MKNIDLSSVEKTKLEDRHRSCRDVRECDRIKAVLLKAEGWSISMIAQALRKHETSILRHLQDYIDEKKLTTSNGGSKGKLNESQTAELIAHLTENLYQHNHQVLSYIRARWNINFTVSGFHKWLVAHGFVYKQPKGRPYKVNLEQQQVFIKQYNELKDAIGEDEVILFGDGVHPTQATKLTHGWIKKGTDKEVNTTASRTRLNIFGAIRLGFLNEAVTHQYERIDTTSIIDFLNRLRQQYASYNTLHLILDGAGYHKAKLVQEKAAELNIQIHILPPYSPNLNPIERLWKVMNEQVRNNQFFHSAKEFREKINAFFQRILPEMASSLDSRINDNFERLKPAS